MSELTIIKCTICLSMMFKFNVSFESNLSIDAESGHAVFIKNMNYTESIYLMVDKFVISVPQDSTLFDFEWQEVVAIVNKLLNYLKIDSVSTIKYEKVD